MEVQDDAAGQLSLGQHTLDNAADELLVATLLGEDLSGSGLLLTAGITAIGEIYVVGHLLTGKLDLVSVDDDNVVTTIDMRCEIGLVLAAQ